MMPAIDKKLIAKIVIGVLGLLALLIASLAVQANPWLTAALLLWVAGIALCASNAVNRIALLCFLVAFFVFLLGREVCFSFFGLERYYEYLEPYNDYVFSMLALSLFCLLGGYVLAGFTVKSPSTLKGRHLSAVKSLGSYCSHGYSFICAVVFFACAVVSIAQIGFQISFVMQNGYLASYIDSAQQSFFMRIGEYFVEFFPIAACLYLATCPEKKLSLVSLGVLELYAVLTLFTGHRFTFVATTMLCIVYICARHRIEDSWINKKAIVVLIVLIPVAIIALLAIDSIRVGRGFTFSGIGGTAVSFLDQQGGSVNVIKRVLYYEKEISDMFLVSFDSVRTNLCDNTIMRTLFGTTSYSGNSVEHALLGHSLAHRLSYLDYGKNLYLAGHGVGSCYIAELLHDFGPVGVAVGGILYGVILRRIDAIQFVHCFASGLLLAMFCDLVLAPRGGFDGFLGNVTSLVAISGFVAIALSSWVFNRCCRKTVKEGAHENRSEREDEND